MVNKIIKILKYYDVHNFETYPLIYVCDKTFLRKSYKQPLNSKLKILSYYAIDP